MYRMKAAASELDYPITYDLAAGDSITASSWAVEALGEGADGGLAVKPGSEQVDGATTACLLTGGIEGRRYRVANTITTAQGRKDERSMLFRIGPVEVQA